MNILQGMANPNTATNLSNIGIGQAGSIGEQNIASANQSAMDRGARTADIAGGLSSAFSAYMSRPPAGQAPQAGASINPTDYSSYV